MPLPVVAFLVSVFTLGTTEYVIVGLLPDLAVDLNVSIPTVGLLVTAYALGVVFGGPIVTAVTTRLPRKPLMIALMCVFALGNLISAIAPVYGIVVVARVLAALSHAPFFAVSLVVATDLVPQEKRGSAVAQVTAGLNLATVFGVPIGTYIGQHLGWRATFWCVFAASLVAIMLLIFLVPRPASFTPPAVRREISVFRRSGVLLAIGMTVLAQTGVFTSFTYLAPLLTEVAGFSAGWITPLMLVYGAGSLAGTLLGGKFSDRSPVGSIRVLLSMLVVCLAMFSLTLGSKVSAVLAVFVVGGVSYSIIPPLQSRVMGQAVGAPTLALTVNVAAFQLANALGSWLGGRVIDANLGFSAINYVGAVASLLGLAVAVVVLRGAKREPELTPAT